MRTKLICVISLLGLLVGLLACAAPATTQPSAPKTPTQPAVPKTPIKIGAVYELTGGVADMGTDLRRGTEFALDEVGRQVAGRQIELIVADAASSPTTTVDVTKRLVLSDNVDVILGPVLSDSMLALLAFVKPYGTPVLETITMVPEPGQYDNTFSLEGTEDTMYWALGAYAYEKLGYKTASAMVMEHVGGMVTIKYAGSTFEAKGGKVTQLQPIPLTTTDYSPYLLALKKADFVYASPWAIGVFIQQYRKFGINMPLLISSAGWTPQASLDQAGDAALGIITEGCWSSLLDNPLNKAFVEAFKKKLNHVPSYYEAQAYAMTKAYLETVKLTGGDTSKGAIIDAMHRVNIDTILGPLSFDSLGVGKVQSYILKTIKLADGSYGWQVIDKYPFAYRKNVTWTFTPPK